VIPLILHGENEKQERRNQKQRYQSNSRLGEDVSHFATTNPWTVFSALSSSARQYFNKTSEMLQHLILSNNERDYKVLSTIIQSITLVAQGGLTASSCHLALRGLHVSNPFLAPRVCHQVYTRPTYVSDRSLQRRLRHRKRQLPHIPVVFAARAGWYPS
jgi:hypothetical protein